MYIAYRAGTIKIAEAFLPSLLFNRATDNDMQTYQWSHCNCLQSIAAQ